MSGDVVMMDPALVAELTTALERLADVGEAVAAQVAGILQAGDLSSTAPVALRDVADRSRHAAGETAGVLARHAEAEQTGAGRFGALADVLRPSGFDPVPVADALATLRAARGDLDGDGDGALDDDELRAGVHATDPDVAAAAAFVLDGAPAYPSSTSADAPRPTVPELLAVVNSIDPVDRSRLVAELVADVNSSGNPRAVGFEVVAAGTPMDASEREEAELLSIEPPTVPTLERLRTWDLAVPELDPGVLADIGTSAPAGTAAVALTYRAEDIVHEYVHDPIPDLPPALAELVGGAAYANDAASRGGAPANPRASKWLLVAATGLYIWRGLDWMYGDRPRMDTNVVFDVESFDGNGHSLGTREVHMARRGASELLLPGPGSVVVLRHVEH